MPQQIDKYEVIGRLGSGGMGTVYKARDPVLGRFVAIKVISPDRETGDSRTRFFSEARACAALRHPNIVTVHTIGEDAGQVFIVMELVEGAELKDIISQRGGISLERKIEMMISLCDALHYAHTQNVIHRDIKPGNIIVERDTTVKLIDFGIAKMLTSTALTQTGSVMGTLRYISPEQARGQADARSDQYSLGAVFFEMLVYRPPYLGEGIVEMLEAIRTTDVPPLRSLDPDIPADLAAAVERALRRDPDERYPDLATMKLDLEGARRRLAEQTTRQVFDRDGAGQRGNTTTAPDAEGLRARAAAAAPRSVAVQYVAAGVAAAAIVGLIVRQYPSPAPALPPAFSDTGREVLPVAAPIGPAATPAPVAAPAPAAAPSIPRAETPTRASDPAEPGAPLSKADEEMQIAATQAVKALAETARGQMNSARDEAVENQAGQYAAEAYRRAAGNAARAREAWSRGEYAKAARFYDNATTEYRASAMQARAAVDLLAQDLERAIRETAEAKTQAVAAGADAKAREMFRSGTDKQAEAAKLAQNGKLAAAAAAQRAAAGFYRQAVQRTKSIAPGPSGDPPSQERSVTPFG